MNEFIVWSVSGQRFLKINEFSISMESKIILLREGKIFDVVKSGQEYILYNGIGKIDIEGNKIYADSSIVVFTFLDNKLREHEVIGYFYFNDTDLGYWIEMIDQADVKYNHTRFYANRVKDLKIIDTLQENKLGLLDM